MKYDNDDVQGVMARQGLTDPEVRALFRALEDAETRYIGLGNPSPESVDRAWVEAKSAAYNDVQNLRARLYDLNDHRRKS